MYQVLWWVLYPCYSIYFSQQLCELDVSICILGFPGTLVAQRVKHLPAMQETWVRSLSQEDPLEKEMATHSSTLAWKIPWTEKPGRLQSMGSQRVEHNWATSLTPLGSSASEDSACNAGNPGSIPGLGRSPAGRHGNPLPMDRGAWWATIHGVAKSLTQLSN